jgi:hypothetical protein
MVGGTERCGTAGVTCARHYATGGDGPCKVDM